VSDSFPDPPKGSPGEIRAAARSLRSVAAQLEHADGGLQGATGSLWGSWEGGAAQAYRSSADTLGVTVRRAAQTFQTCARAVSGYATALEDAQSTIRRLRVHYDDAMSRETAATATAWQLSQALATASKSSKDQIKGQIGAAQRNESAAVGDASSYAAAARAALTSFKALESRYETELGGDPLGPLSAQPMIGGPPSFGIPPGGLSPYNGVIPVVEHPSPVQGGPSLGADIGGVFGGVVAVAGGTLSGTACLAGTAPDDDDPVTAIMGIDAGAHCVVAAGGPIGVGAGLIFTAGGDLLDKILP